jgi:hypothetical protein
MRTVFTTTGWALGLLLATSTAWAQPAAPRPGDDGGVHRMTIYNGPLRTVHYVYTGDSSSEAASIRDLERAENDVALADQVQQLRLTYLRHERELENRRHQVQMLLYGYSSETSAGLSGATGGLPAFAGYGPYGVTGGYFTPGYGIAGPAAADYGYGAGIALAGFSVSAGSNSLAYGVGDEGVVKTMLARTMPDLTAPDFSARANANLHAALSNASRSKGMQKAMGVSEPIAYAGGGYGAESQFGVARDDAVSVTMRLGGKEEQVKGTVLGEDHDWLRLRTDAGEETIRKSDIMRVVKTKK